MQDEDSDADGSAWGRLDEELRGEGAPEALRGLTLHGSMLMAANAMALAKKSFDEAARYPFTTMDADRELRVTERMLIIAEVASRIARHLEGR